MFIERTQMNMTKTLVGNTVLRASLLALCMTALSAAPVMAQDPATPPAQQDQGGPGGGMRGGRQVEMLTKNLNLTPDQVTQVKAIDDDQMKQMTAVRNDSSLQQADRRQKMMDIRKAGQDKIRAILTDEQKTKYDDMLAKMQARRGQGGGGPQ
jgi:periplasmic protein CpxP/Spy